MLQLGTFEPDPFNARMNVTGPGSFAFLQAGVIQVLGYNSAYLFDRSVGILLMVVAFYYLFRYKPLPILATISLITFFLLEISYLLVVNATPTYIIFPFLFALFCILDNNGLNKRENSIIIGLLLGAFLTLKNTMVPFVVLMFLALALVGIVTQRDIRSNVIKNTVISVFIAFFIVFIWYMPQLTSNVFLNTEKQPFTTLVKYLYLYFKRSHYFMYALIINVFLAGACFIVMGRQKRIWLGGIALFVSSMLGIAIFIFISDGAVIIRYDYPIILFSSFVFVVFLFNAIEAKSYKRILLIVMVAFGLAITFKNDLKGKHFQDFIKNYSESINVLLSVKENSFSSQETKAIKAIQEKTELGSKILVRINRPFLLDFSRDVLYVADLPCMTSIIPGMVCSNNADDIINYLKLSGISYVMYEYETINTISSFYSTRMRQQEDPLVNAKGLILINNIYNFDKAILHLGAYSKRVYDDGNLVLIALSTYPSVNK